MKMFNNHLTTIKRKLKSEAGQVLPMALVMLVLGGLLVVPTLSLMTTSLTANREVDQANLELYAADAGVEQVLWNMQYNIYDTLDNPYGIVLPDDGGETPLPGGTFYVNGKEVDAKIIKVAGQPYKITSTATNADGHSTTVECYIDMEADLSYFFDSTITSKTTVTIKPGTEITGPVTYGTENGLDNQGCIDNDGDGTCDEPGGTYDPDLADNWPTADYLSGYYLEQVDDLEPSTISQITISGGLTNPTPIPRMYRIGSLLLKGGGWARLGVDTKAGTADAAEANFLSDADGGFAASDVGSTVRNTTDNTYASVTSYVSSEKLGISEDIMANDETYTMYNNNCTVYVTGPLSVNPTGDCVLDLNGNTFFSGDTIYLGPKTTLRGSGCFIAVGDITFQPNLGSAGDKLVGVDYTTPYSGAETNNKLLLSKFTAEAGGNIKTFSLVCAPSASGNVKLAVYDADNVTGAPLHRLGYTTAPVGSGTNGSVLHDIAFPETAVEAGKSYWLAAISDTQVIGYKLLTPATWESKTVATSYSEFDFPEDLTGYSLPDESTKQYLLAGNALPFVFVMSIEGTSLMQPNGDLYGAIAGDAEVYIKPGCTLELTDVPEAGLDFPGEDSGSDEDAGSPLTVRTYTIE